MSVETLMEDPRWAVCELEKLADRAAAATFDHLGLSGLTCTCLGADDARVAALNGAFRGNARPTNVLSWPSVDLSPPVPGALPPPPDDPEIGDMALAFETCSAEAEQAGIAMADHVTHLVVHGVLHLLGYDHQTDPDADLMENTEIAILMSLGIVNPYA